MKDIKVEKVMDRKKLSDALHEIITTGVTLLSKDKFEQVDFGKIKVLRTLGTHVNAAVTMVQQETAQMRAQIVQERLKQLGFSDPKQLT